MKARRRRVEKRDSEVNAPETAPARPAGAEDQAMPDNDTAAESSQENPTGIPRVLTVEAVAKGEMPESGSGLPPSLEPDILPRFRFWKCDDPEARRRVRDALVESGFVTESNLELVKVGDAEPVLRRVEFVTKTILRSFNDDEPVVVPSPRTDIEKAAELLEDGDGDTPTVIFGRDVVKTFGVEAVAEKVGDLATDWLVEADDDADAREVFKAIGHVVTLRTRPGAFFASSARFVDSPIIERHTTTPTDRLVAKAFADDREIPILKAEEERIVYGIVLEPDEVDAQNDTIDAEEIRKACHLFMEEHGTLGLQHKEAINGKVKLLENYIAPVSFKVAGEKVKKGTWLMMWRVVDDELWAAVKAGDITGFSIGGHAVRKPDK